jgi:hypothetical protein
VRDAHQRSQEELHYLGSTVNDEIVEFTPVYFLQELLNEPILSRPAPNDCIVLIAEKEPDGHDSEVSSEYWRPACATLMHLLPDQSQHGRHAGSANVDV